ncbi:MAG: class A beta-lactamase-related serine hydrolase [Defluviitaleaceae bacterium]|nr:class A beta-lactamase-related serine hydrolase [Defluviitaleaceae bacterium]
MKNKNLTLSHTLYCGILAIIVAIIVCVAAVAFFMATSVNVSALSIHQHQVQHQVTEQTWLFDSVGGRIIGQISPQTVTVLETRGQWHLIETWLGGLWIHEDYEAHLRQRRIETIARHQDEMLAEITAFLRPFYNDVSVHYENLGSGFTFSSRGDVVYFAASAAKLAFALYIYDKTERRLASMDELITYTELDHWEGSGVIRHRYNFGEQFNQRELLRLMLVPSDNIATRLLRRMHGLSGFRDFIISIGGNPTLLHNVTYGELTANEGGLFLREIYRYFNSGGVYSQEFANNMLNNQYKFIISSHPVASKTGWAANFGAAYHDLAIIKAPSPYSLAILSRFAGEPAERRIFEQISRFFEDFNRRWFE